MNPTDILFPILCIGGLGIVLGIGLGFAGKIFHVEVNPKVTEVLEALPGANCGACGFAGCANLAELIADGNAPINACPVGGGALVEKIAAIMGAEVGKTEKRVAYVKCAGNFSDAVYRYDYYGIADCRAVSMLAGGGSKQCAYGCIGSGSCVRACQYDALSIADGVAVVDPEKCVACGLCLPKCPRGLLEMVPYDSNVRVACNSRDPGKVVRANCKVGCIACKLCEKACGYDAIHLENNLSRIDYSKCTMCGDCVKKCPMKTIKIIDEG